MKKKKIIKKPLIQHLVIEIYEVNSDLLIDHNKLLPLIKKFIKETGINVVNELYHDFKPFGSTLIFILSSSHLAVHTWPENNFLHLDLLSCHKISNTSRLRHILSQLFKTNKVKIRRVEY